jgi:hypothetical protein
MKCGNTGDSRLFLLKQNWDVSYFYFIINFIFQNPKYYINYKNFEMSRKN